MRYVYILTHCRSLLLASREHRLHPCLAVGSPGLSANSNVREQTLPHLLHETIIIVVSIYSSFIQRATTPRQLCSSKMQANWKQQDCSEDLRAHRRQVALLYFMTK